MPTCDDCLAWESNGYKPSLGPAVEMARSTWRWSFPPHGMDWGETCSRCGLTAEVCIE